MGNTDDRPLISVIIPVYNAEKYLAACLNSVQQQTYTHLEILVVIDGSPDGSGEIAKVHAESDIRIKVIDQDNGGVSRARNNGIALGTGDYIVFVDADDMLHPEMIERLYEAMLQNGSDISFCNVSCVEEWKTLDDCMHMNLLHTNETENMTGRDLTGRMFFGDLGMNGTVPWNKLFRREQWAEKAFPVDTRYEDELIIYQILYPLQKCTYLHENLYFYRRDNSSFMDEISWEKDKRLSEVLFSQAEYFRQQKDADFYNKKLAGAQQYLALFILHFMNEDGLQQVVSERMAYFREKYKKEVLRSGISLKQKMFLGLFCVNRNLYGKILRRKGLL